MNSKSKPIDTEDQLTSMACRQSASAARQRAASFTPFKGCRLGIQNPDALWCPAIVVAL